MILLSAGPGTAPNEIPGVNGDGKVQELWHREATWQAERNASLASKALDNPPALFLYKSLTLSVPHFISCKIGVKANNALSS